MARIRDVYLAYEADADALRAYRALTGPEKEEADILWRRAVTRHLDQVNGSVGANTKDIANHLIEHARGGTVAVWRARAVGFMAQAAPWAAVAVLIIARK